MEEERSVTVCLATEIKFISIPYFTGWTAEDICIAVCKKLKIGPLARHLFALRCMEYKLWIPAGQKLETQEKNKFEFRLRFKPSSHKKLESIDLNAYNYYFHQVRCDVLENKVSDIVYEKHKHELIDLGVSDMYRVIVEKQIPREVVEADYKKYIPKECIEKYSFSIKSLIHNELEELSGYDVAYVKNQYLDQFEQIAPNYLSEEYKAIMNKNRQELGSKVLLRVNPSEVMYCKLDIHNQWTNLCDIEDLCSLAIWDNNTVAVSRKIGAPLFLKFSTNSLLMSFVSVLDGYYRLAVKWTFKLCDDVIIPSLEKLKKMKCHGPVGLEFSHAKLKKTCYNRTGTYILRECEKEYNVFWLDSSGKDHKRRTYKIQELETKSFKITGFAQTFNYISHIISSFNDFAKTLYLSECLPPSESDKFPFLICAREKVCNDFTADGKIITALTESGPFIISSPELRFNKEEPFPQNINKSITIEQGSLTSVYQASWQITQGKKLEAVLKLLRCDELMYIKEFHKLADKWGELRSNALVRMYGLKISPSLGMLMELVKLGPLDIYLQSKPIQSIKTVDMIEAATCLANALLYMANCGYIHGKIRCRKLYVHVHSETSFMIKLAAPGLLCYTSADIHWLPPETYKNYDLAGLSTGADIWAFGTTLWQIFSRGALPPINHDIEYTKKFYSNGQRLRQPKVCPEEVYKLITECWGNSRQGRKEPFKIVDDLNKILYETRSKERSLEQKNIL